MSWGVNLPRGTTATSLLHGWMVQVALDQVVRDEGPFDKWMERFGYSAISPDDLGESVVLFEALRAADPNRVELAEKLTRLAADSMVFNPLNGPPIPLGELMAQPAKPLNLIKTTYRKSQGLRPRVHYRGETFEDTQLHPLARRMGEDRHISRAAAGVLHDFGGRPDHLSLNGIKFVMMGAAAGLSPVELLLEGGATVLWLDRLSPRDWTMRLMPLGGTLLHPEGNADLLTQPGEIAATIADFAGSDRVHIGAFATAVGNDQEWRLTAAMNAVLRALPGGIVSSIGLYISPMAPAKMDEEDARHIASRKANWLESFLGITGYPSKNHFTHDRQTWVRPTLSHLGGSYLAAQYLETRIAAEVWAINGLNDHPVTVSANVAGISRTRSMETPFFQAVFSGAPSLGLEIYDPRTIRWLNGLLYLHDILNPESPTNASQLHGKDDRADDLSNKQVHGGIFTHPFATEDLLRAAAKFGSLTSAQLIAQALAKRFKR